MILRVARGDEGDLSKALVRFTTEEKDASKSVAELWKVSEGKKTEVTGWYSWGSSYFRISYYTYTYFVPVYYFVPTYFTSYVYYTYYW